MYRSVLPRTPSARSCLLTERVFLSPRSVAYSDLNEIDCEVKGVPTCICAPRIRTCWSLFGTSQGFPHFKRLTLGNCTVQGNRILGYHASYFTLLILQPGVTIYPKYSHSAVSSWCFTLYNPWANFYFSYILNYYCVIFVASAIMIG